MRSSRVCSVAAVVSAFMVVPLETIAPANSFLHSEHVNYTRWRGQAGMHMKQPDPAALQAVIDKMEIGEMQSRYMFALDWHEPEVYSSMFTEDATLEWPEGHAKGREAIHCRISSLRT